MASISAPCTRGSVSSTCGAQASLGHTAAGFCPASVQLRTGVPCSVEHYGCSRRQSSNITGLAVSVGCRCCQALASSGTGRPRTTESFESSEVRITERRWRDFFSDPSQWWDHRAEKDNPRYPDFRHKETRAGLWVNGNLNPPWVEAELASMAQSTILQEPLFSWNKRLSRFVKTGQYEKALDHFYLMEERSIRPDRFTFTSALKACAKVHALKEGRRIHSLVLQQGSGSDLFVSSCLVDMYARCGSIDDARGVFDEMPSRDVVAWNAIIHGHARCGQGETALELSRQMRIEGVEPDTVTFVGMLNACARIAALEEGMHVHEQIIQRGLDSGVFVGSSLIDMYAACGRLDEARRVFYELPKRDVVCWNAMISGSVKCGQWRAALDLSVPMKREGVEPNTATFVGLLSACAGEGALADGRQLHQQAIERGVDSDLTVSNTLIHMYSECGRMREAWVEFNRMPVRNVMSWNALIEGFVKCGKDKHALELYWELHRQKVEPNNATFVTVLNVCARLSARKEGMRVHESIARRGLEFVPSISVALIHMYAFCRRLEDAWTVFCEMPLRDVRSYNAMLQGYVKCGQGRKALQLYERMLLEKLEPDVGTFVEVLDACAVSGALEEGKSVHLEICGRGLELDASVHRSLSRMYAKCERLNKLRTDFGKLPRHDEISLVRLLDGD